MPKYLIHASYTVEGTKGLLKDGGSKRRKQIKNAIESLKGKLEAFYYGFGDSDVYVIVELPDNVSAATLSLAVTASGAARPKTTVLLTPEEIDQATKTSFRYRPPGK